MGIPVYFSHIIEKYSYILKKIHHKINFDVFFFDANSIIYDIYYELLKNKDYVNYNDLENKIINKSIEKINTIINMFNIEKEVIICFDGIAPLSKLKQQRERRFKSWMTKEIVNENNRSQEWNTCNISPGTNFMNKLNIKLNEYQKNFYKINKNRKEKIIILDSDVNGEGEQKIFNYLKNNYKIEKLSENMKKINLNICVYGLDSDLIMLSLLHSNFYNNIHLFRETPEFIKNLNKELNPNDKYLLNINELSSCLCKTLYTPDTLIGKTNINDYIFKTNINYIILFFLIGNDFVPHNQSLSLRLNGSDILIELYQNHLQDKDLFYIQDNSVLMYWKHFKHIVKELSKIEYESMIQFNEYKTKIHNKIIKNNKIMDQKKDILNYSPLFHMEQEEFIISDEKYYKERYYDISFGTDYDVKDICYHYLKNIEWTLLYYMGDKKCDLNYYYPYYHAPFFSDLLQYVPLSIETLYTKNIDNSNNYINSITQLLYILPSCYYNLISEKYKNIVDIIKKNNNYNYLFNNPDNLIREIDYNFVKYFFEASIHFKETNILQLNENILEAIEKERK